MGLLDIIKLYKNKIEEIEDTHLYDIDIDDSDIQSSYNYKNENENDKN